MSLPKYSKELSWKEFSVSLIAMEAWLKANAGSDYCGNSADEDKMTLWFLEQPSQEIIDAIDAKWDGLDEESEEAEAYQSREEQEEAAALKRASGKSKLAELGLDADELKALFGL